MASLGNASPSHTQSLLSEQISLLDVLFPGFTTLSSSPWPLFTGATSLYGRLLCICGLLVLIAKFGPQYFGNLLEAHFSQSIRL